MACTSLSCVTANDASVNIVWFPAIETSRRSLRDTAEPMVMSASATLEPPASEAEESDADRDRAALVDAEREKVDVRAERGTSPDVSGR